MLCDVLVCSGSQLRIEYPLFTAGGQHASNVVIYCPEIRDENSIAPIAFTCECPNSTVSYVPGSTLITFNGKVYDMQGETLPGGITSCEVHVWPSHRILLQWNCVSPCRKRKVSTLVATLVAFEDIAAAYACGFKTFACAGGDEVEYNSAHRLVRFRGVTYEIPQPAAFDTSKKTQVDLLQRDRLCIRLHSPELSWIIASKRHGDVAC